MKKYLLFLCLLATISAAFAQTQRGYVKTRGRLAANGSLIPGTRLTGATITFKGNVAVVSGPNGAFSYPMRSKTFSVESVKKKGYQLYDPDLLGRTHSYSSNDLLVVMDTPENVLEDRLAAVRKIRNTLQKQLNEKTNELAALKKQHKITEEEYQKKIQALQKAQDKNEELISEMAERYSTLDFEAMDDFRRRVAAYIQNGELTRADSLLNTKGSMEERCAELAREREALRENAENLKKRLEEQEKGEAHYAKKLEDFAADCYNHFEICKLRHDNDSAAYWIELRACQDSTNVDWQLQAGRFIDDYIADYHKALRYYQRALHSAMVQEGEKCEHVATSYNNIGLVYKSQGNYPKALEMLQKALGIWLDVLGANHPYVATSYSNIGVVYDSQGNYPKALEMHQKALDIDLEVLGANHPDVATSYNNQGLVYKSQGNYPKALEMYQKALAIRLEVLGANHPYVATSYNNIGSVYDSQGNYPKALEMYQKALDIGLDVLGANHPDVARSYNNMGCVYHSQGNYPKALEMYQKSLDILLEVLGANHPDVARSYNNIGSIYDSQGNYPKALEMYQKALDIKLEVLGANHPDVARSYNNMGLVYESQGDYPKALEMHQKALDIKLEVLGANHPDVATSYNNLGSVYHSQGNYPKALEMYQKALGIWLDVLGANHPDVATSYNNMGSVYYSQGNYPKALEMYQKALGIWLEVYGENHSEVATLYDYICSVYYSAKEQGVELPGFKDFTQSGLFACETVGDDTPAAKAGMSGTYYMLEFADWTLDSDASIFAKNNEMRGKPKNIVVMRGDKIARLHFEDRIGVQFVFKKVGEEERQRVLKAYRAWKESQGNRHE